MYNLLFIDTEATGVGDEDRLIQVAYKDSEGTVVNELFKPPVSIKLSAMAVHHITENMVAHKPAFLSSKVARDLTAMSYRTGNDTVLFIAHNASYDLGMLKKEGVLFDNYICTLKVARFIDDGTMENHQLQYLRYYYGLDIDLGGLSPHDALADIIVLEAVFWKLFSAVAEKEGLIDEDEVLSRMIEISKTPVLIKNCKWPKHQDVPWAEVVKIDRDYMMWQLNNQLAKPYKEQNEDIVYTLKYYLNKAR